MGILGGYNYTADYVILVQILIYNAIYIMYHVLCISWIKLIDWLMQNAEFQCQIRMLMPNANAKR